MYKIKPLIIITAILAALMTITARGESAPGGAETGSAQNLIAQARAAIGGEANLKAVRSLSAFGRLRRVIGNVDQSGEIKLDLLLPDKFKMTTTLSVAQGVEISLDTILNGDEAWKNSISSSNGAPVISLKQDSPANRVADLQDVRASFTRYALSFLLTAPVGSQVEFTYIGEAEATDGRADVIEAKGASGFETRFFFDKKTHRLLMISYHIMRAARPPTGPVVDATPQDISKVVKEAQGQASNQQYAEIQVSFSDYRAVEGIYLPHRLMRTIDGQPIEEWELEGYKLNPTLKPEKFLKK